MPERLPYSDLKDPAKRAELRERNFPHVLTTEGLSPDEREVVTNLTGASKQAADIFSWQEYCDSPRDIWGYFWPKGVTQEEVENASLKNLNILDPRFVVRKNSLGLLEPISVHVIFREEFLKMAQFFREAAKKTRGPQRNDLEAMADYIYRGDFYRYDGVRFSARNSRYRINHTIGIYDANIDRFMNNKYSAEGVVQILDEDLTYELDGYKESFIRTYESEFGQKAPEIRMRIDHVPHIAALPAAYGWSANSLPPQSERPDFGSEFSVYITVMDKKVAERTTPVFRAITKSPQTDAIRDGAIRNIYLKRLIGHEIAHSLGDRSDAQFRLKDFYTATNELYCDLLSLYLHSRMQTALPQEYEVALQLSLAEGKLEYIDFQTTGTRLEYLKSSSVILKSLDERDNVYVRNGIINVRSFLGAFGTIKNLLDEVQTILEAGSKEDAERFFKEHFDENLYARIPYRENGSRSQ